MLEEVKKLYPNITSISKPLDRDDFLEEVEKKLGGEV
jgi:hypothetical protein